MSLISRFNAAMQKRDPHGIALRRAARTAIAVPVSIIILTSIPAISDTALFGVFAVLALLVFSDFGGRPTDKLTAYSITILVGIPIMVLGSLAGQTIAGAMILMAIVALLLGVLGVLRGPIASAQTTLLLATVLAVTSSPPDSYVTGAIAWVIGGIIATVAALLLWPLPQSTELRLNLSALLRKFAQVISMRWSPDRGDKQMQELAAEFNTMFYAFHEQYDGNLERPGGITEEDRALADLVDIVGRFRTYEHWSTADELLAQSDETLVQANRKLAADVSWSLTKTADLLAGDAANPSPGKLAEARTIHLDEMSDWTARARATHSPAEIAEQLDEAFPLRLSSASTELAAASALTATGHRGQAQFTDEFLIGTVDRPRRSAWTRIKAHIAWDSPWFRNALRSAVALSISVGIAKYLGLGHEFWIVLGTLSALRFDALGTGRTVLQAFFGTALGVLVAIPLIVWFGDNTAMWWVLLPISLFVAAFTPGTFSLAAGQAGFSFAVLVLFSLLFPADILTAELRILEVAIGLGVSVFVALLMWPRGVSATLYKRMSEAVSAATDHMVASMDHTCGGAIDAVALSGYAQRANAAIDRAQEAYDLSIAQKPPEAVPMRDWSRISNAARHVDFAAQIYPGMIHSARRRGNQRTIPEPLVGPMLDAASEVRDELRLNLDSWLAATSTSKGGSSAQPTAPTDSPDRPDLTWLDAGRPTSPAIERLRRATAAYMKLPSDWHGQGSDPRPALVSWLTDWSEFIEWTSATLRSEREKNRVETSA